MSHFSLTLYKIEDNLNSGITIYNKYVHKTRQEIEQMKRQHKKAQREKMLRKKEQADNVKRKEQERLLHKERSLKGIEAKKKDSEAKEGPQYTGRLKKAVEDFHDATGAGIVNTGLTPAYCVPVFTGCKSTHRHITCYLLDTIY